MSGGQRTGPAAGLRQGADRGRGLGRAPLVCVSIPHQHRESSAEWRREGTVRVHGAVCVLMEKTYGIKPQSTQQTAGTSPEKIRCYRTTVQGQQPRLASPVLGAAPAACGNGVFLSPRTSPDPGGRSRPSERPALLSQKVTAGVSETPPCNPVTTGSAFRFVFWFLTLGAVQKRKRQSVKGTEVVWGDTLEKDILKPDLSNSSPTTIFHPR